MTAPGSRTAPADSQAPGYPVARRDDLTEDLHGQQVPDPYRWLEDPASADTQEWLAAQDTLWAAAEAGLPGRSRLAARLQELMAAGYVGAPAWRGPRQFFMRRQPGQEPLDDRGADVDESHVEHPVQRACRRVVAPQLDPPREPVA